MKQNFSKTKLTKRSEDYSQWYLDVAKNGELFEYSPTPGCITFLPKAVNIWEKIKSEIDKRLIYLGVQNLYLPLLIPMSFFEKEKDHVEGFAPELAVVTHGGGKDLDEKLAIRPTSETLFCDFFKNKLHSYRDLPLLYNQWVNVMRWEKRTRPFLRTAEFYWQEGHTLHETGEEALNFSKAILHDVYVDVLNNFLAISGVAGKKSDSEKFAGADSTFTYEPIMSNGWALQICTSHMLSQDFMKSFDVSFLGREGKTDFPFYTSWGMSTRSIGGIISSHSDDKGLIIPPKLSEYRAVILPIYGNDQSEEVINLYAKNIAQNILGGGKFIPVKGEYFGAFVGENGDKILIDYRNVRLGEKLTDFELSGYPLAVVFGARDITDPGVCKNGKCEIRSRITGEKEIIDINPGILNEKIEEALNKGQKHLLEQSRNRIENSIVPCANISEIGVALEEGKFAIYEWDLNPDFEKEIKDKFKATTRCMPFEGQFTDSLMTLKNKDNVIVIVARAF